MFNRFPSPYLASVAAGVRTVTVPFATIGLEGKTLSFIVSLFTDPQGTTLLKSSSQSAGVPVNGGSQNSAPATIDLTGKPQGEYYVGVTPFINGAAQPTKMASPTDTVVISGITIGNPIWS